jgi:Flp pilus assembly protein TadG
VSQRGSALVEFQFLAILLLVPLVYVMLAALDVQRTVFGATQAAREAGRIAASTGDESAARYAAGRSLHDQGVDPGVVAVTFTCTTGCQTPGGQITVRVATMVGLPFLPDVLAEVASIPVSATHVAPIDRYRA